MQKLTKRFLELNQKINSIEQQYGSLVNLNQEKNAIEQSGLKEIQLELSRLVNQMKN